MSPFLFRSLGPRYNHLALVVSPWLTGFFWELRVGVGFAEVVVAHR